METRLACDDKIVEVGVTSGVETVGDTAIAGVRVNVTLGSTIGLRMGVMGVRLVLKHPPISIEIKIPNPKSFLTNAVFITSFRFMHTYQRIDSLWKGLIPFIESQEFNPISS
jgi:hypothetical protein